MAVWPELKFYEVIPIEKTKTNNKTLILIGLLIGLIFAELDETIVSTAMPTIIRELHGLSLYGWVAGVYMLTLTMFMPILGKLADLYGRRRIYLICIGLFIAGSIVSGMASSMTILLIGRGIQGIGAGGLMPLALVIIGEAYPLEQRAKIQSLFGPMMIIPQLLGPTVGGYIVGNIDWHWVFLINIPIGLLAALFIAKGMQESIGNEKRYIDWAGACTLILALLSLLLTPVLIDNQGYAWSSPIIIGLLSLSALLFALLVWIEAKAKEPIIPLHLFRNRNVVVLSLLVFILMLGIMGGMATFPFFAQHVMGLTPTEAGYLMLAFMAGAIPASIVNGFLITRIAYRSLFIVSFLLPIAGFLMLTQIGVATTWIYIVGAFFVLGVGLGALFGGDNLIVQESVDAKDSGIALSTVQLFQSLGATIGLSIFGSLLSKHIKDGIAALDSRLPADAAANIETGNIPADLPTALLHDIKQVFSYSFQNMFVISLVFAIAAFILCWFLKKEVLSKKAEEGMGTESGAGAGG